MATSVFLKTKVVDFMKKGNFRFVVVFAFLFGAYSCW